MQKACLAVLARYERQGDEYRERFVRRLRVEGEAVALVDARGARAAFAGAKTKSHGSSAEIELPLSALPELNQAPLSYLLGVAVLGELSEALRAVPRAEHPSSGEAPTLAEGWARLELATPVGFGPQPALLAAAFAEPASVMNGGLMAQRSYAPHEPGTIRVVSVPDVAVADGGPAPNVPGAIGAPELTATRQRRRPTKFSRARRIATYQKAQRSRSVNVHVLRALPARPSSEAIARQEASRGATPPMKRMVSSSEAICAKPSKSSCAGGRRIRRAVVRVGPIMGVSCFCAA